MAIKNQNKEEIWKDIVGYEGIYQVSNLGNIEKFYENNEERIVKPHGDKDGYMIINLYKNKKEYSFRVHRLVAQAFIPNPENKPCVDHISTIRNDNRVENLRWVTYRENNNNPLSLKHLRESCKNRILSEERRRKLIIANSKRKGKNHPNYSKRGSECSWSKSVYCFELDEFWGSISECAKDLNLVNSNISRVCRGERKTVGGYHFRYANKNEG